MDMVFYSNIIIWCGTLQSNIKIFFFCYKNIKFNKNYQAGLVVKHKFDTNAGSLKDPDLFRRFFICMNYEIRKVKSYKKRNEKEEYTQNKDFYFKNEQEIDQTGLYIQYGIIQGYDSKETVHLSYFDQDPLELRYYMFGR